jgi:hypothetical protein
MASEKTKKGRYCHATLQDKKNVTPEQYLAFLGKMAKKPEKYSPSHKDE